MVENWWLGLDVDLFRAFIFVIRLLGRLAGGMSLSSVKDG